VFGQRSNLLLRHSYRGGFGCSKFHASCIALRKVECHRDILVLVLIEKKYAAKQRSVRILCRTNPLYGDQTDVNFRRSITFRPEGPEIRERDNTSGLAFLVFETAFP